MKISEYYTSLSSLWEEIDSLNALPSVADITPEMSKLLKAIETTKEESRLFQFMNGLDEVYGAQRSQLLMLSPLPSVEVAYAVIQQEESLREVLTQGNVFDTDVMAMYSKGSCDKLPVCSSCGKKGHSSDRCWIVIGYPKWHTKYRPGQKITNVKSPSNKPYTPRVANNVQGNIDNQQVTMTSKQLEQILKLIPNAGADQKETETDEEIDYGFSGMVYK
ncbi:hypothetical protein AgCh_021356 [Apium graveolens]